MKSTGRTLWRSSACSSRSLLAWSAPYRHARPARRKSRRAKHRQATLQARTHQCTLCKRCHKTIRHQRAPSRVRLLDRDLSLTPSDDRVLQSQVHAGYAQGSNVPVPFVQAIIKLVIPCLSFTVHQNSIMCINGVLMHNK